MPSWQRPGARPKYSARKSNKALRLELYDSGPQAELRMNSSRHEGHCQSEVLTIRVSKDQPAVPFQELEECI